MATHSEPIGLDVVGAPDVGLGAQFADFAGRLGDRFTRFGADGSMGATPLAGAVFDRWTLPLGAEGGIDVFGLDALDGFARDWGSYDGYDDAGLFGLDAPFVVPVDPVAHPAGIDSTGLSAGPRRGRRLVPVAAGPRPEAAPSPRPREQWRAAPGGALSPYPRALGRAGAVDASLLRFPDARATVHGAGAPVVLAEAGPTPDWTAADGLAPAARGAELLLDAVGDRWQPPTAEAVSTWLVPADAPVAHRRAAQGRPASARPGRWGFGPLAAVALAAPPVASGAPGDLAARAEAFEAGAESFETSAEAAPALGRAPSEGPVALPTWVDTSVGDLIRPVASAPAGTAPSAEPTARAGLPRSAGPLAAPAAVPGRPALRGAAAPIASRAVGASPRVPVRAGFERASPLRAAGTVAALRAAAPGRSGAAGAPAPSVFRTAPAGAAQVAGASWGARIAAAPGTPWTPGVAASVEPSPARSRGGAPWTPGGTPWTPPGVAPGLSARGTPWRPAGAARAVATEQQIAGRTAIGRAGAPSPAASPWQRVGAPADLVRPMGPPAAAAEGRAEIAEGVPRGAAAPSVVRPSGVGPIAAAQASTPGVTARPAALGGVASAGARIGRAAPRPSGSVARAARLPATPLWTPASAAAPTLGTTAAAWAAAAAGYDGPATARLATALRAGRTLTPALVQAMRLGGEAPASRTGPWARSTPGDLVRPVPATSPVMEATTATVAPAARRGSPASAVTPPIALDTPTALGAPAARTTSGAPFVPAATATSPLLSAPAGPTAGLSGLAERWLPPAVAAALRIAATGAPSARSLESVRAGGGSTVDATFVRPAADAAAAPLAHAEVAGAEVAGPAARRAQDAATPAGAAALAAAQQVLRARGGASATAPSAPTELRGATGEMVRAARARPTPWAAAGARAAPPGVAGRRGAAWAGLLHGRAVATDARGPGAFAAALEARTLGAVDPREGGEASSLTAAAPAGPSAGAFHGAPGGLVRPLAAPAGLAALAGLEAGTPWSPRAVAAARAALAAGRAPGVGPAVTPGELAAGGLAAGGLAAARAGDLVVPTAAPSLVGPAAARTATGRALAARTRTMLQTLRGARITAPAAARPPAGRGTPAAQGALVAPELGAPGGAPGRGVSRRGSVMDLPLPGEAGALPAERRLPDRVGTWLRTAFDDAGPAPTPVAGAEPADAPGALVAPSVVTSVGGDGSAAPANLRRALSTFGRAARAAGGAPTPTAPAGDLVQTGGAPAAPQPTRAAEAATPPAFAGRLFGDRGPASITPPSSSGRVMVETGRASGGGEVLRSTGKKGGGKAKTGEAERHEKADQIDENLSPEEIETIAGDVIDRLRRIIEFEMTRLGEDEWD